MAEDAVEPPHHEETVRNSAGTWAFLAVLVIAGTLLVGGTVVSLLKLV